MPFVDIFRKFFPEKTHGAPHWDHEVQKKVTQAVRALRADNEATGIPAMRHFLIPGPEGIVTVNRVVRDQIEFIEYNPLWVEDNSTANISQAIDALMRETGQA